MIIFMGLYCEKLHKLCAQKVKQKGMLNMLVMDLVETKKLLVGETGENVVVVYERYENIDYRYDGTNIQGIERDSEEIVQILEGNEGESLTNRKKYFVGEKFDTVDEIINDIRTNYSHLLK